MNPPNKQGEVNTDPRFIYSDDANVIAYRLGIVETDLSSMNAKLDRIINEYPTVSYLNLILQPMRDKIKELEDEKKVEIGEKAKQQQAFKIAVFSAVVSPIATIIIAVIMAKTLGLAAT